MSARGFTKNLFRGKLYGLFVTVEKTTAVSLISDNTHWYDLYVLFGKTLEVNARWK